MTKIRHSHIQKTSENVPLHHLFIDNVHYFVETMRYYQKKHYFCKQL